MGFIPLGQQPQSAPQQKTIGKFTPLESPQKLEQNTPLLSGLKGPATTAVGVVEQIPVGMYGLFKDAIAGIGAGISTVDKLLNEDTSGKSAAEIYTTEHNDLRGIIEDNNPTVFMTDQGKALYDAASRVTGKAVEGFGNTAYVLGRIPTSPSDVFEAKLREGTPLDAQSAAAGALAEAGLVGATLVGVPGGAKGKIPAGGRRAAPEGRGIPSPQQIIDQFDAQFPGTADAIKGSQVGRIDVGASMDTIYGAVNKALDKELGIPTQLSPNLPGKGEFDVLAGMDHSLSLGDKFRLLVMKYTPEVPVADQIRFANAQVDKILMLDSIQRSAIDSIPKLPPPAEKAPRAQPTPGEPLSVTPAGTVIPKGVEQVAPSFDRPALPAPGTSTGDVMVVSPEGKIMTPEQRRTQQAAYDWEKKKLQAWIDEGEALSGKIYVPKKQRGSVDIENLPDLYEKAIKDAYAQAVKGSVAAFPKLGAEKITEAREQAKAAMQEIADQSGWTELGGTYNTVPFQMLEQLGPQAAKDYAAHKGLYYETGASLWDLKKEGKDWGEVQRLAKEQDAALGIASEQATPPTVASGSIGEYKDYLRKLDEKLYEHNNHALAEIARGNYDVPIKAAHGTLNEFGIGEYQNGRGIAPHFGSLEQANTFARTGVDSGSMFLSDKMGSLQVPGGNIRPVDLYLKNPLRTKDLAWESPSLLLDQLLNMDAITSEQWQMIRRQAAARVDPSTTRSGYTADVVEAGLRPGGSLRDAFYDDLKAALGENGYDSIVYRNDVEGQPNRHNEHPSGLSNDSYIAFYPREQVKFRGTKEMGSVDLEGLPEAVQQSVDAVKNLAKKGWYAPPSNAADIADRALQNNYDAMDKKRIKIFSTDTLKSIRRAVVSHDYDLQAALKKGGPLAEQAVMEMNIQHNATMVAKTRYDKSKARIFDDLTPEEKMDLEKLIRLRRIVQIDQYKGVGTVAHEIDPKTGQQLNGPIALAAINKMKGQSNFDLLNTRANSYFTEELVNLRRLYDEGLLSDELYNKMKNLDYSRTEYLDIIDPNIPITSKIRGFPQSISGSGIPKLGAGKQAPVNMNAVGMLVEDTARVENRIAVNRTLKALHNLAVQQPDNGIVMIPKLVKEVKGGSKVKDVPKGWTSLGVMVEGKQRHILMRDDLAEQFVTRPDVGLNTVVMRLGDMEVTLGAVLRTASLSNVFKATTTTYNPAFGILAGLPMDIAHLWAAQARTYSPQLPIYMAQIGKDLAVTAKDVFTRTGRWQQAMQEGMGNNFLTHEGRGAIVGTKGVFADMEPRFEKLRTAAAYLNDSMDMWVRMAHRERLINQGIEPRTATAMAVERLNYYRGGSLTKFVDSMIPYTNIAVNATSKVIETGAKDPMALATKVAWATSTFSAVKLASMMMSPETDKAISVEDKVRNVNITPFGDQIYFHDIDGNKRYPYIPIRLDQTFMPFKAAVEAGMEWGEYNKVPDGVFTKAIGQVMPLSSMIPPSAEAVMRYMRNYDPYRDHPIYQGKPLEPQAEKRGPTKSGATAPWAVAAGEAVGASPMRLEQAAGAVVNSNNFYLASAGSMWKFMFGDENPRANDTTMEMIQNIPGLRNVVKFTSPGITQMQEMDKIERQANSIMKDRFDRLDELAFKYQNKKDGVTEKDIRDYISLQPSEFQKMLKDHVKYTISVDQVMKKFEASDGVPPRGWWIKSNKLDDEPRAQVFYNEWVSAAPADRKRMEAIGNSLQRMGTGYFSDRFKKEFSRNVQLTGTERR